MELDLTEAIEASARAEYECDREDELAEKRIEWAEALPLVREHYLRRVRAAAPIIERAVREHHARVLAEAVVLMYERFMTVHGEKTRLAGDGVAKVNAAYLVARAALDA